MNNPILQRPNFYIITGCSGSGKSTIIDALRARGFLCVNEAGREIVREQLDRGGDATPWENPIKFRDLLYERYLAAFEQVAERTKPVFFDRGLPELIGFAQLLPVPQAHYDAIRTHRYATRVFVTPPWKEIYTKDAERKHSFEDGLREYPITCRSYLESGYRIIEVPKAPVEERVALIVRLVGE